MTRTALRSLPVRGLILLACGGAAFAQPNLEPGADPGPPRAVLDRFLALNAARQLNGAEGRALLAGELDEADGPTFGPLPAPDRILMLADESAVARLPAEGEVRPDLYLYLRRRDGAWTIHALRTLALTGVLSELRRQARAMPSRSPDMERALRNAELTLSSDRSLRAWFGENRLALESLRAMAAARRESAGEYPLRIDTPEAMAILGRLHLNGVAVSRGGSVHVSIGGILDNEVGFLHVPDPGAVPPIDPIDHIWIEPLGGGWYLFKTT